MRVREVSVTYAGAAFAHPGAPVQSLSVTGAVRNLALWTRIRASTPR